MYNGRAKGIYSRERLAWVEVEEVGFEASPEACKGGVRKVERSRAGVTHGGNCNYTPEHDWPGHQDVVEDKEGK